MASDKDAKIEKARQLAESGKFVSAISAWRELLDETPHNDANVYNTIGDLCLKNKATPDAIDAYSKAARFYLQEGFHLKSVALYKKILKLDPNRAEVYTLLGDLNVVRGLMNNAVADYLSGAKTYLKTGKAMNALTLFRKITKVDPQNMEMRLRVAELCLKENLTEEGIEEYLRIGREYQRLSRAEEAGKLYEQVLKVSPDHPEARRRLDNLLEPVVDAPESAAPAAEELTVADAVQSAVALETPAAPEPVPATIGSPPTLDEVRRVLAAGEVEEAERMIRTLLLEDPDRSEYQAVLGMLYLKKGHASIACDILYPMAKSWLKEGRREEAVEIVEAFLAVEPDDTKFLALKAEVSGVPAEAVASAAAGLEISQEACTPADEHSAAVPADGLTGSIEFNVEGLEFESHTASSPVTPAAPQEDEAPVLEVEVAAPSLDLSPSGAAVVSQIVPGEVLESPVVAGSLQAMGGECEAIFEQLRAGINDQAGDEEFETHYDLGIAYKEMGLIAEAIEEFQLAARGPTRFVDACAMIAACYKDQNLSTSAIAFLERVLADARCGGASVPYVKYDLAVLYEDEGFADKAVRLYEDIPSIRDVEAHLRRLQGNEEPTARPPAGTRRPVSYL
ncbi:MAG: tetratricopeptide repeat protein [Nitrospirales bacterium]|nr:tetratricopeptide repeat protein [Nitrospirales bacterium]